VWQLQANGSNSQTKGAGQAPGGRPSRTGRVRRGGTVAALIYFGASFVAALVFWLITAFTGSYPAVARWGGAVWVFILVMIVLMPIVIPRVARWQQRSADGEEGCAL
jgi:hypothetical protein